MMHKDPLDVLILFMLLGPSVKVPPVLSNTNLAAAAKCPFDYDVTRANDEKSSFLMS